MTEGMKKYQLAFASGVINIEVMETAFRDRKELAAAVKLGRVIRAVVVVPSSRHRTRSAQYVNLGLVERIL